MAKRPVSKKKKASLRKKNSGNGIYLAFLASIVAGVSLGALFYFVFLHRDRIPAVIDQTVATINRQLPGITYEEPQPPNIEHDLLVTKKPLPAPGVVRPVRKVAKSVKKSNKAKPKVALIIDDMGYMQKTGEALLALDLNLNFAFLPYGPHTDALVDLAKARGRQIILHLPMEPADAKWDPGKGALLLSMNSKTIRNQLEKDMAAVYQAAGMNNHMGSRFTQNREAMTEFLTMVKRHDMFFIDSYTSRNSKGFQIAKELGVRTARRDVFIDNERNKGKIKKQIERLVRLAEKRGSAIGIGHPHASTYAAIRESVRMLKSRVKLVRVDTLVH